MHPTQRLFGLFGALGAADSVAGGAFGAHALRERLGDRALEIFVTAGRYEMYHALALLVLVALWSQLAERDRKLVTASGWCFVGGILFFSGSLYALALTGITMLGAVAPVGGVSFIVGWALLALAIWRGRVAPRGATAESTTPSSATPSN